MPANSPMEDAMEALHNTLLQALEDRDDILLQELKDRDEYVFKLLSDIREDIQLMKRPRLAEKELGEAEDVVPDEQHEADDIVPDERYEFVDAIGHGSYGSVYKVIERKSGMTFAMKQIQLEDKEVNKNVAREISLLIDSKHDNIVRLHQVLCSTTSLYLFMEYIPLNLNEEMQIWPKKFKATPMIKRFLKELLSALAYLHDKSIIHRDVKPENILIDENGKFILADFGFARAADSQLTPQVTTLQYRAPEVLLGSVSYTTAVDIWAVGCIFAELLISAPAFTEGSESDVITDIFSKLGKPTEAEWPELSDLLQEDIQIFPETELEADASLDDDGKCLLLQLLAVVPTKRISAEDALKHPFLSSE